VPKQGIFASSTPVIAVTGERTSPLSSPSAEARSTAVVDRFGKRLASSAACSRAALLDVVLGGASVIRCASLSQSALRLVAVTFPQRSGTGTPEVAARARRWRRCGAT